MKKVLIGASILICIVTGSFFWVFIKSETVSNVHLLSVSVNNDELKVETNESAKYISSLNGKKLSDTLSISVKTTTVLNPFAEKSYYKLIKLNPEVKFIEIANKVVLVSALQKSNDNRLFPL